MPACACCSRCAQAGVSWDARHPVRARAQALDAGTAAVLPEGLRTELEQLEDNGGVRHLHDLVAQIKARRTPEPARPGRRRARRDAPRPARAAPYAQARTPRPRPRPERAARGAQELRRVAGEDLARVEGELTREAREDAELRQQHGRAWARPASAALNSTLLEKVAGARPRPRPAPPAAPARAAGPALCVHACQRRPARRSMSTMPPARPYCVTGPVRIHMAARPSPELEPGRRAQATRPTWWRRARATRGWRRACSSSRRRSARCRWTTPSRRCRGCRRAPPRSCCVPFETACRRCAGARPARRVRALRPRLGARAGRACAA